MRECFFGTFGRTNAASWQQRRKPIWSNKIDSSRTRHSDVASSEGGAKRRKSVLEGVGSGRISFAVNVKDARHLPWKGLGMGAYAMS
jgi:hypothetical protein